MVSAVFEDLTAILINLEQSHKMFVYVTADYIIVSLSIN